MTDESGNRFEEPPRPDRATVAQVIATFSIAVYLTSAVYLFPLSLLIAFLVGKLAAWFFDFTSFSIILPVVVLNVSYFAWIVAVVTRDQLNRARKR